MKCTVYDYANLLLSLQIRRGIESTVTLDPFNYKCDTFLNIWWLVKKILLVYRHQTQFSKLKNALEIFLILKPFQKMEAGCNSRTMPYPISRGRGPFDPYSLNDLNPRAVIQEFGQYKARASKLCPAARGRWGAGDIGKIVTQVSNFLIVICLKRCDTRSSDQVCLH